MRTAHLPNTPAEAATIKPGTLGIAALKEALSAIPDEQARRAMARLIEKSGRKYSHVARIIAGKYGEGAISLGDIAA